MPVQEAEEKKVINVFISYSRTTTDHQKWVQNLAARLEERVEFNVTFDKWDLKTGQDVMAFMERMAKDNALIDKVVVVLDKGYTEKANKRERGAGIEAQIISAEVYQEINQVKFLPIVRELDEEGNPYRPVFLQNRIYVDFSKNDEFEEAFDKLARDILDQPEDVRPSKVGPLPAYFYDKSIRRYKTSQMASGIESVLNNRPNQLTSKILEFFDVFYTELASLQFEIIDNSPLVIGKQLLDRLEEYTPMREDLLLFLSNILKSGLDFDVDILIQFFSRLPTYTYSSGFDKGYHEIHADLYKFINHELLLSVLGLSLKNHAYTLVEDILYSCYSIATNYIPTAQYSYRYFYKYANSITSYYESINSNLSIPQATLLFNRASSFVTPAYLVAADLMCYHIGDLNNIRFNNFDDGNWFPLLYIYQSKGSLDLYKRLSSARYFEKVKGIYGVKTPQELIDKITEFERTHPNPISSSSGPVTPIYRLIDKDTIAKNR